MPRSKNTTPQASLFDDSAAYVARSARSLRLERAGQLARLIVADVEQIRALIRELHPPGPVQPEDDA